jgi:hypothetical protein
MEDTLIGLSKRTLCKYYKTKSKLDDLAHFTNVASYNKRSTEMKKSNLGREQIIKDNLLLERV